MWHIIRMRQSWIFRLSHFWCEKIVLGAKIKIFKNFFDDVIIPLNQQNWRKISLYNLLNESCIRKGKINIPMLSLIIVCFRVHCELWTSQNTNHSNKLDELIPNMHNTLVILLIWPFLAKKWSELTVFGHFN